MTGVFVVCAAALAIAFIAGRFVISHRPEPEDVCAVRYQRNDNVVRFDRRNPSESGYRVPCRPEECYRTVEEEWTKLGELRRDFVYFGASDGRILGFMRWDALASVRALLESDERRVLRFAACGSDFSYTWYNGSVPLGEVAEQTARKWRESRPGALIVQTPDTWHYRLIHEGSPAVSYPEAAFIQ